MENTFEQIRDQIHDIRNIIAPIDLKMANLEAQVLDWKRAFTQKSLTLESKVIGALFRLDQQDTKIAEIIQRITQLESRQKTE